MKYLGIGILLIIMLVGGGFLWVSRTASASAGSSTTPVRFTISAGEGVREVSDRLKQKNLIVSEQAWTLYVVLTGRRSALLAGDYTLQQAMTGREIATLLADGKIDTNEVSVKILEGWTAEQIAKELEKKNIVSSSDFLAAVATTDSRTVLPDTYYAFLKDKPATANLEGFLFPDTYRFFVDTTAAQVLKKFLDNFGQKYTATLQAAAVAKNRTTFEVVTMASILEDELRTDRDRAKAADLFWRRLDIGMALQSDATVNYVTGKGRAQPSIEDTKVDSPYNTYKYPGLPPGPIGNPGVSALRAAVSPEPNTFFYYLSAPDGTTYFAETYEQHLANKAKYLP